MKIILKLLFLTVLLFSQPAFSQIVINEYSCANASSGGDPDFFGEFEDWVELYNTSGTALDLNGFYLSDKASNPTKFQIPGSIGIPPGGYLMVYASGRGIIDSLTIQNHQLLDSRGRTTDGAATWSVFTNSTPGASNANAMQEYATIPQLSVFPGFYASAQSVAISSPDSNVDIYYTLDGSEPSASSTLYSTPINVATTTVVRAIAISTDPNIPPSFIETNTYFINVNHVVPV